MRDVGTAAGRGLAFVFTALKRLRPARPIHPIGLHLEGRLERSGNSLASGISWLDEAGKNDVEARLSRSAGLPSRLPDIIGLALRVTAEDGQADILLASSGTSRAGRYLLQPRRDVRAAALTTVMPYRGAHGPVQLAARTIRPNVRLPADPAGFRRALGSEDWVLALFHAQPWGPWRRFATLTLRLAQGGGDTGLRFDPIVHRLPDAGTYRWIEKLRAPSYAVSRRARPRG